MVWNSKRWSKILFLMSLSWRLVSTYWDRANHHHVSSFYFPALLSLKPKPKSKSNSYHLNRILPLLHFNLDLKLNSSNFTHFSCGYILCCESTFDSDFKYGNKRLWKIVENILWTNLTNPKIYWLIEIFLWMREESREIKSSKKKGDKLHLKDSLLKQKSRHGCIQEGDQNTKYFQHVMK